MSRARRCGPSGSPLRGASGTLGRLLGLLLLVATAACASAGGPANPLFGRLPGVPRGDGELALDLVYPEEDGAVAVRDSTFVFGSTGSGRATLTINGVAVDVAGNGAFLAFLPVPADGIYRLEAVLDGRAQRLERVVELPEPPPLADTVGILAGTVAPAGALALTSGESVVVRFRGRSGGSAWLVTASGDRLPMFETVLAAERREGADFERVSLEGPDAPSRLSNYERLYTVRSSWLADSLANMPGVGSMDSTAAPTVELVLGPDTVRAIVPANLALLDPGAQRVAVAVAPEDAESDWTIRGRNDVSGPFHDFWPAGTRFVVTGQRNGMLRVRLTADRVSWVPASDVTILPVGSPPPHSAIEGVRLEPADAWIDVRVPLDVPSAFRTSVDDRTIQLDVFGAVSRVNFFQYGALDALVEYAEWSQPSEDGFRVTVRLTQPVWGYHTFLDADGALVLRIRRPPEIDVDRPLAGLLIAVDAGHPPLGATGPTRLTEAEANLSVALRLETLLEQAGARVFMTRTTAEAVDLGARPRMAAQAGAHVLVSVHNNAFPDGVNPFENAGTSVYYYQAQSAALAAHVQGALLSALGLRDLGIGRADLALVRPTWMPAVLSETMFLMVPRHEAALRDPDVIDRIARAHIEGLVGWLREFAERGRSSSSTRF